MGATTMEGSPPQDGAAIVGRMAVRAGERRGLSGARLSAADARKPLPAMPHYMGAAPRPASPARRKKPVAIEPRCDRRPRPDHQPGKDPDQWLTTI
jgi:hypothetical protein